MGRAWGCETEGGAMRHRLLYLIVAVGLVVAACGSDDDGGDGGSGGDGGLGVERVQLAIDTDDYMNNLAWVVADERYWRDMGFEEAEVVATDEYMAGLLGGDVWVAQGESDVTWAALAEGSVPLKIVGVEKDTEAWFIGINKGVDKDNQDAAIEIGKPYGLEPAEGDLAEWDTEITGNWSLDGGAPAEAFDQWNQDMIDNENVPEDFDWKEHADFTCLWKVQEKLDLDQNPV